MTLVDTGPLVALFDPQDEQHNRCRRILREIRDAIPTTTPVLTEAFHMLGPASIGSDRLREFVEAGGLSVWFLDRPWLTRAFELMEVYADDPMDWGDASLLAAAEALGMRRVFTIDRKDFETHRVRRGQDGVIPLAAEPVARIGQGLRGGGLDALPPANWRGSAHRRDAARCPPHDGESRSRNGEAVCRSAQEHRTFTRWTSGYLRKRCSHRSDSHRRPDPIHV